MKTRVRLILKLLRDETAFNISCQLPRTLDRTLHSSFVRHIFKLATQHFDEFHFFCCKTVRYAEDNAIASCDANQCQPNPRVSGRGFDNGCPGTQSALFFGIQDHPQGSSVLNRTSRIESFQFCVNVGQRRWSKAGEMKQRSVAY